MMEHRLARRRVAVEHGPVAGSACPRCAAIRLARCTIAPARSASPAARSLSVAMCRRGMIRMCVGACGLMSLNATRRSSSWTMSPGISRAAILQNQAVGHGGSRGQARQRPESGGGDHGGARKSLKIRSDIEHIEARGRGDKAAERVSLPRSDLGDDACVRAQPGPRGVQQLAQRIESVRASVQGYPRLVQANLGRQRGELAGRNVGQVGYQQVDPRGVVGRRSGQPVG